MVALFFIFYIIIMLYTSILNIALNIVPFLLMLWFYIYCYYILKDAYLTKDLKDKIDKLYIFSFLVFFAYPAYIAVITAFMFPEYFNEASLLKLHLAYLQIMFEESHVGWSSVTFLVLYAFISKDELRSLAYHTELCITLWTLFILCFYWPFPAFAEPLAHVLAYYF